MGGKHCWKRRNCSLRAISPFPTVFTKDLYLQTRKNQGLFWKGLRVVQFESFCRQQIKFNLNFEKDGKYCGKRRKCWLPAFSLLPTMFTKPFLLSRDFGIDQFESFRRRQNEKQLKK